MVRNPLDCFTSLFNMLLTSSHNYSITDEDYINLHKEWDDFIKQEITVWNDFHGFWINTSIPVHIVRYEDII